MASLNSLSSQIIRQLSGGNPSTDTTLLRRDIILRIRQVMNELLKLEILTKRSIGDRTPVTQYIATYSAVSFAYDETVGEYWFNLMENYLALPYNRAIHSIFVTGDPASQLIRRNQPYVTNVLRSSQLEGQQGYYVEGIRVILDQPLVVKTKDKLTYKLFIAAPETLENDDTLPVIPEQEAEIIRRIVADMVAVPASEDKLSDQADQRA